MHLDLLDLDNLLLEIFHQVFLVLLQHIHFQNQFLLIFFVIIEKISEAPIVFPIVKEVAGKWRVIH